jgi:exoribonuclease R
MKKLNSLFTKKDMRKCFCFSIDDKGTKVMDDVISVENFHDKAWKIGIHISDIS